MKPVVRDPVVLERMRVALDLSEAAMEMMLQNLRRRFPDADEAEIRRRFDEWLCHRPGAEHGDASGPGFRAVDPRERFG